MVQLDAVMGITLTGDASVGAVGDCQSVGFRKAFDLPQFFDCFQLPHKAQFAFG